MSIITTIEQLEALYGFPNDASTVKVADRVTPPYRALIENSPFAALATCGPEGLDCSPRGDLPGFVRIHDDITLMMPDRRGNNRVDSLRNIVRDPRVALLFLIPGLRHDAAHQRPRASFGRSRSAGLVQDGKQGAALGRRHDGQGDLFPVRPRHRPRRSLEH
jgi:predicted pyridoxine 5'-phosphate oxidase superfamily flavin-nucleotide-binding protein